MSKRLGHGRKVVRVEILKAIEPEGGYKGLEVYINGGRAESTNEQFIIDCVWADRQGSIYIYA